MLKQIKKPGIKVKTIQAPLNATTDIPGNGCESNYTDVVMAVSQIDVTISLVRLRGGENNRRSV